MRIAHYLPLIAVLHLTAILKSVCPQEHYNSTLLRVKREHTNKHNWLYRTAGEWLNTRENQMLLRNESRAFNMTEIDCCPTVQEMVEPKKGVNQDGMLVELFRDGKNCQRFYEVSCHRDYLNKACRFMDKKLHHNSKCVQKYSYTYAIVRDLGGPNSRPTFPSFAAGPGETKWTLDYIKVRSGCSCVVTPNHKKKRDRPKHKRRHEDAG